MNNDQSPEQKPEQVRYTGKQPQTNDNPSGAPLRVEQETAEETNKKTADHKANSGDDSE